MSRYGVPFVKGPRVKLSPHPEACGLEGVRDIAAKAQGPLAIDLFCGAGGLSYGLHLAGFNVIVAAEKDLEAAETHRAHFGGATICADLSDQGVIDRICDALSDIEVDLVAGGPPCQPYSQAAFSKVRHLEAFHGRKADSRRDLWSSYVQIVERTQPKAILVENVPDMAFGRDGIVLRRLVHDLELLGYEVHTRVLASDAFGVPQHRQRLFTVAFRQPRSFQWPVRDDFMQRVLKDAIEDLPEVEAGDKQEVRPYSAIPSALQRFFRQPLSSDDAAVVYDHYTRAVRADDLEAFKLMTSHTRYCELPAHLKRYRDDIFEDKYKRLDMEKLSRTITAHISQDGYWYIHPTQHRTLTIREAARIQTFPDNFRFCGYPRHAFRQIGEAVPPLVAKAVGVSILQALGSKVVERKASTRDTVHVIRQWFSAQSATDMKMPWLGASTLWEKVLGHVLFDRSSGIQALSAYQTTLARWDSPTTLLADPNANEFASSRFKFEAYESLCLIAKALSGGATISAPLLQACGVPASSALRILATTGIGTRRPLNASLERLVRRFTGIVPRPEDGRGNAEMQLGRMVGVDEDGAVFRAANEIASRYCGVAIVACSKCPLRPLCNHARRFPEPENSLAENAKLEVLVSTR